MRQLTNMREFESSAELARALADRVRLFLTSAMEIQGRAVLAVSGGSTPVPVFEELAASALDWKNVTITLVDERYVPPDHPRSNEKLVREHLLKGNAAAARFVPLFDPSAASLTSAADNASSSIRQLGKIDASILGMGVDGHTASFFPGGDNLAVALDMASPRHVVAMRAAGAGEPRLTLTLPVIVGSAFLALHVEGAHKRETLELAMTAGPAETLPIRAVLDSAGARLEIFWAP